MEKTLIFVDFHFHLWKHFGVNPSSGLPKRLESQISILKQILNILKKRKITRVIVGGDLCHKTGEIPVEVINILNWFFKELDSLGVKYVLGDGNHDMVNVVNPKWFQITTNIFKKENGLDLEKEKIKLIPYNEEVDYEKIKGYDLVLLHKIPLNSQVSGHVFKEGVDWKTLAKNNKLVLFEHIHQGQKLSDNCFVLGAPMIHSFGEEGERGVYIINEDLTLEFIKLEYPQFLTIEKGEKIEEDGNYYRVLGADKKIDKENVVTIIKPKYFEEKLKGNSFFEILEEWLILNKEDKSYLEVIKDIIKNKLVSLKSIFKGRLVGVSIKNYLTIESIKYKIEDGFILVKGENESGKTNLFDAIYYCLTGETTKILPQEEIIKKGEKDVEVILGLEDEQNKIKLTRSIKDGVEILVENKKTKNTKLLTQGLRKDDKQRILESFLGITKELFLSTCYFSQENLKMLTQMGEADRNSLLTNLLGFSCYSDLQEEVKNKIKKEKEKISILEKNKENFCFQMQSNESNILLLRGQQKQKINNISDFLVCIDGYGNKIKELKDRVFSIEKEENYDELILSYEMGYQDLDRQFLKNKEKKEKCLEEKNNIFLEKKEIEHKILNIEEKKKSLIQEIEELKSQKIDEKCNKCGSLITSQNVSLFIEEKEKEILGYENNLKNIFLLLNQQNILFKNKEKEYGDINSEEIKIKEFKLSNQEKIKKLNGKKLEQIEKRNYIDKEKLKVDSKIMEYEGIIQNYKNSIEKYKQENKILEESIQKLSEGNQSLEENKIEVSNQIKNLEGEISKLNFWVEAFSYRGIKAVLLGRFCNEFNGIVNKYISLISNGLIQITMTPDKLTKSGEERNALNLVINEGEMEYSYRGLSGGAKRKVDVSLCLALNEWVSFKYGIPKYGLLGLIILDELFCYLDDKSEELTASLLYEEGKERGVYVISHTNNLDSYSQNIWEVKKESNGTNVYFKKCI